MKGIYSLDIDCGRMGDLQGKFVADSEEVKTLLDSKLEVYWGEVLGKHSEVVGSIEPKEINLISDDPNVVEMFEINNFSSGYNPFHYYTYDRTTMGEDYDDDLDVQEAVERLINRNK